MRYFVFVGLFPIKKANLKEYAMIKIIVNKHAGSGKAADALNTVEEILRSKNIGYVVFDTEETHDALPLAKEVCAQEDTDTVIVLGGDGTLHQVLNGFDNFEKINLGIIPCGTGNDFAAAANLPTDIAKSLDVILTGNAKHTDYFQMGDIRGINAIGTGIDVDVLVRYAKHKKRTKSTYLKSLLSSLIHFKPYCIAKTVNGETTERSSLIVLAANGKYIGGGLNVAPDSVMDDGLIDIVVVDSMRKPALPFALVKLLKGKILKLKQTTLERAKEVLIKLKDESGPVQVDGEIYSGVPMDIKLVSGKLKVFRP